MKKFLFVVLVVFLVTLMGCPQPESPTVPDTPPANTGGNGSGTGGNTPPVEDLGKVISFERNDYLDEWENTPDHNYLFDGHANELISNFPTTFGESELLAVKISGKTTKAFNGLLQVVLREGSSIGEQIAHYNIPLYVAAREAFTICVPLRTYREITSESNPYLSFAYDEHVSNLDEGMDITNWEISLVQNPVAVTYTYHINDWSYPKEAIKGFDNYLPTWVDTVQWWERGTAGSMYFDWHCPFETQYICWYGNEGCNGNEFLKVPASSTLGDRDFYGKSYIRTSLNEWWRDDNDHSQGTDYNHRFDGKVNQFFDSFPVTLTAGQTLFVQIAGKTDKNINGSLSLWMDQWNGNIGQDDIHIGSADFILNVAAGTPFNICVPLFVENDIYANNGGDIGFGFDISPNDCSLTENIRITDLTVTAVENVTPVDITYHVGGWTRTMPAVPGYDYFLPNLITPARQGENPWNAFYQYFDDYPEFSSVEWHENADFTDSPKTKITVPESDTDLYSSYNIRFVKSDDWDEDDGSPTHNFDFNDRVEKLIGSFPDSVSSGQLLGVKITGKPDRTMSGLLTVNLNKWDQDYSEWDEQNVAVTKVPFTFTAGQEFELYVPLVTDSVITAENDPALCFYYSPKWCTADAELGISDLKISWVENPQPVTYTFKSGNWTQQRIGIADKPFNLPTLSVRPADPNENEWTLLGEYFDWDVQWNFAGNWYDNEQCSGNPVTCKTASTPTTLYGKCRITFSRDSHDDGSYEYNYWSEVRNVICNFPYSGTAGTTLAVEITGKPDKDFSGLLTTYLNKWDDSADWVIAHEETPLMLTAGTPFKICIPFHVEQDFTFENNPAIGLIYQTYSSTLDAELTINDFSMKVVENPTVNTLTYHIGDWTYEEDIVSGYDYYLPVIAEGINPDKDDKTDLFIYFDCYWFTFDIQGWYSNEGCTGTALTKITASNNTGDINLYAKNDLYFVDIGQTHDSKNRDWWIAQAEGRGTMFKIPHLTAGKQYTISISGQLSEAVTGAFNYIFVEWDNEGNMHDVLGGGAIDSLNGNQNLNLEYTFTYRNNDFTPNGNPDSIQLVFCLFSQDAVPIPDIKITDFEVTIEEVTE